MPLHKIAKKKGITRRKKAGPSVPKAKSRSLKLVVDLVPSSQWGKNLRKQVAQSVWDRIRKEAYTKAGNKCEICGIVGRLNCHEKWEYDEKNLVQHLTGFQAVCNMCNRVTHFGFFSNLASQNGKTNEDIVNHFLKVNNVSLKVFREHLEIQKKVWKHRSQFDWTLDFGEWRKLISP